MVNIPKVKFLECCLATIDCYLFTFIHFIHNSALVTLTADSAVIFLKYIHIPSSSKMSPNGLFTWLM